MDLLIRGGTVYDGSGAPGRITVVGVRGDRITFVSSPKPLTAYQARMVAS